ncbi:MAG: hypothetical protein H0Z40_11535 [Desulfotomaculum sp.]|nr:hypothetical protein [Desulfotomaculum sp.]
MAIIDAYDVIVHGRPYKNRMTKQEAINELIRCSGSQFDPKLLDVFISIISINNNVTYR